MKICLLYSKEDFPTAQMRGFLRGVFATKDLISNQADILVISEMDALAEELFSYVIDVASGEETVNEKKDFREISIFKSGVVL